MDDFRHEAPERGQSIELLDGTVESPEPAEGEMGRHRIGKFRRDLIEHSYRARSQRTARLLRINQKHGRGRRAKPLDRRNGAHAARRKGRQLDPEPAIGQALDSLDPHQGFIDFRRRMNSIGEVGRMRREDLGFTAGIGRPGHGCFYAFLSFEPKQCLREQRLPFGTNAFGRGVVGKQQRIEQRIFRSAAPIVGAPGLMAAIVGSTCTVRSPRTTLQVFPHGTGGTDPGKPCQYSS